jgi:hypothetical protein
MKVDSLEHRHVRTCLALTVSHIPIGDDAPNQKRYDTTHTGAGIIFEPESDDDVDDDDPDDDLDF